MHVPMRRQDRMTNETEAWDILTKCEYGTLGTVCEDGSPYNTPISYVALEGCVYFHCAKTGRKLDHIRRDPRVCFSVVGRTQPVFEKGNYSTAFESAVAFGMASPVEDEAEKRRILEALCRKYLPGAMEYFGAAMASSLAVTDVWRIKIEEISGKAKRPT